MNPITKNVPGSSLYGKTTLYLIGGMGNVTRVECREVRVWNAPYAQHQDAIHLQFVPKGKRNPRGIVLTYQPWFVVVEGQDGPDTGGIFGESTQEANGVSTAKSRYSSHDPRWVEYFEGRLEASDARILVRQNR